MLLGQLQRNIIAMWRELYGLSLGADKFDWNHGKFRASMQYILSASENKANNVTSA